MSEEWVRTWAARPDARVRLVCFPHAGGAAGFFAPWAAAISPLIEVCAVQYPGRADRLAEECVQEMGQLVTAVAAALATERETRSIALFGHSMGAAVAFEVALALEHDYGRKPVHLFVSGRHAPHEVVPGDMHRRSDDELIAELARLGGTHDELLADPALRAMFLPAVRGDFRLDETYRRSGYTALSCPVTVVTGEQDGEVTPEQARRWSEVTVGGTRFESLPGDHFYLVPQAAAVISLIESELATSTGVYTQ
ncbi:hypothetical protein B0T36_19915 [Nocardia donostiensis]|uniref:thioesterase II family protein n=1 Tax=Nocardia donostiensis TaxID=1538463 RepID=UPI0009D91B09|nr:alpha/beta fold hydrolase [Nocardia donostiensis]OQS13374.1 hypothetical protein B0T36_19915 [Nocardia donostiensis]